jgi:signal peptidase II
MRLSLTTAIACILSLAINQLAELIMQPINVIGSFARLTLSHNPHIAFGIPLPYPYKEILIGVALILVVIAAYKARHESWASVAFGMIIGGAAANIIDRLADGTVTDYIAIGTFPVFNTADSFITIGAALLFLDALLHKKKAS